MKTPSSTPAIFMIIENLENEIFIIFNVITLYLKKVSLNASINKQILNHILDLIDL